MTISYFKLVFFFSKIYSVLPINTLTIEQIFGKVYSNDCLVTGITLQIKDNREGQNAEKATEGKTEYSTKGILG